MNLDDTALEDVVAMLMEHLRLRCVHNIAEVHMVLHLALEGHFHRLRDRHSRLTRRQRQRHSARIRSKGHALGHPRVAVSADDDRAVIHSDIIENLVNNVCHRVILIFRIARRNKAEVVHKLHQAWRVRLRLQVPNRGRMTTRLIGTVHRGRQNSRRHRFKLLACHQARGVL